MGGGEPSASAEARGRPGGGLGPPTDSPDPLHNDRWYILGGFAVVLAFGAIYIAKQRPPRVAVVAAGSGAAAVSTRAVERAASAGVPASSATRAASNGRSGLLLEALKEELFQLEMDRQQGSISTEEYEKAKAALDQTLQRAVSRAKK